MNVEWNIVLCLDEFADLILRGLTGAILVDVLIDVLVGSLLY